MWSNIFIFKTPYIFDNILISIYIYYLIISFIYCGLHLKLQASGGKDKTIQIWSVSKDTHLGSFTQHRDSVSGLAFRQGLPSVSLNNHNSTASSSNQLYSCSYDRTVKVWNADELTYIETL